MLRKQTPTKPPQERLLHPNTPPKLTSSWFLSSPNAQAGINVLCAWHRVKGLQGSRADLG